jgi:hypothetical protein
VNGSVKSALIAVDRIAMSVEQDYETARLSIDIEFTRPVPSGYEKTPDLFVPCGCIMHRRSRPLSFFTAAVCSVHNPRISSTRLGVARFSTEETMTRKSKSPASRSHEEATIESFRKNPFLRPSI